MCPINVSFSAPEPLPIGTWEIYSARAPSMAKIPDWVKLASTIIVAFVAIMTWFSYSHVPGQIDSQTKGMSNDISSLKTDVGNVKGDVQRIDTNVTGMMKQLFDAELDSLRSAKKQNSEVVREKLNLVPRLFGAAKQTGFLIDPAIVAKAGTTTLELAKNPDVRDAAWNMNRQLLDYRSFLNTRHTPSTHPMESVPNPEGFVSAFKFKSLPGSGRPR
jgi:hypothetical protein